MLSAGPCHLVAAGCNEARAPHKGGPGPLKNENNPEGSSPTGSRPRRPKTPMDNQTAEAGGCKQLTGSCPVRAMA